MAPRAVLYALLAGCPGWRQAAGRLLAFGRPKWGEAHGTWDDQRRAGGLRLPPTRAASQQGRQRGTRSHANLLPCLTEREGLAMFLLCTRLGRALCEAASSSRAWTGAQPCMHPFCITRGPRDVLHSRRPPGCRCERADGVQRRRGRAGGGVAAGVPGVCARAQAGACGGDARPLPGAAPPTLTLPACVGQPLQPYAGCPEARAGRSLLRPAAVCSARPRYAQETWAVLPPVGCTQSRPVPHSCERCA